LPAPVLADVEALDEVHALIASIAHSNAINRDGFRDGGITGFLLEGLFDLQHSHHSHILVIEDMTMEHP
jgi:hypothetical protein